MPRRLFAPQILPGLLDLIDSEAHHARDVLRLQYGDAVELFDESGHTAVGTVNVCDRKRVAVEVSSVSPPAACAVIELCAALPKGDRAEWMVEKLSELGTTRLQPLITDRTVVTPKGENKLDRFRRIAIEAAKQSERIGVMKIAPPARLTDLANQPFGGLRVCLSTQGDTQPLSTFLASPTASNQQPATQNWPLATAPWQLFIGPEGGWTDAELGLMQSAGLTAVSLTATILRVETAAVVAAALIACARDGAKKG